MIASLFALEKRRAATASSVLSERSLCTTRASELVRTRSGTPAVNTSNQGFVSVANGVVFAGTVDAVGTMYALDAATGNTLWTFASGGSVVAGAAIADGKVYWGSGYAVQGIGLTPNNKLYAFEIK